MRGFWQTPSAITEVESLTHTLYSKNTSRILFNKVFTPF